MQISHRYAFGAPAEVVFNTLTDPHRAHRWLPPGTVAERRGPDRIRVRPGDLAHEYEASTISDEMRVSWYRVDVADARGDAHVRDEPAGGCSVRVQVFSAGPASEALRIRHTLDDAMRRLAGEVSDNFTAG